MVVRRLLSQAPIWPVAVVVGQILVQNTPQLGVVDDEEPIEQLAAERADHPLAARPRCGLAGPGRLQAAGANTAHRLVGVTWTESRADAAAMIAAFRDVANTAHPGW
jgi:hypothetical protein